MPTTGRSRTEPTFGAAALVEAEAEGADEAALELPPAGAEEVVGGTLVPTVAALTDEVDEIVTFEAVVPFATVKNVVATSGPRLAKYSWPNLDTPPSATGKVPRIGRRGHEPESVASVGLREVGRRGKVGRLHEEEPDISTRRNVRTRKKRSSKCGIPVRSRASRRRRGKVLRDLGRVRGRDVERAVVASRDELDPVAEVVAV